MSTKSSILNALKKEKSFLIVSHYHPDGDALGSTLALGLALRKLKKKVVMYNRDPVPYNLSFLPCADLLVSKIPAQKFDCLIMVDCAQPKRVSAEFAKLVGEKNFGKLICIDHHLLDYTVGDLDWIDPKAASTGCVIWGLLQGLKLTKLPKIPDLVYTTLTVDTGSFRYSNTTVSVFELAAQLVKQGASPWFVARNLEESNPIERYSLMGLALKSLFVGLNGKFSSMDVTQEMLRLSKAGDDLSEDFANIPRSIAGVEVSALFREMEDGRIKVSLRSKEYADVSRIAKEFAGGGHKHAAGCIIALPLAAAKKKIESIVAKSLK